MRAEGSERAEGVAGFSAGAANFVEISRFRDPTANFEKKFAKFWERASARQGQMP